jgi:hypothetical protein
MVPDLGAAHAADYSDSGRSDVVQSGVTVALERRRLRFALSSASRRSLRALVLHFALQYFAELLPARRLRRQAALDAHGACLAVTSGAINR